jgi:hypothetical protein
MMVMVTLTVGLVIWIVAWSFGIKAFDAFLFTAFITLVAAGVKIAQPFLKQALEGAPAPPGER